MNGLAFILLLLRACFALAILDDIPPSNDMEDKLIKSLMTNYNKHLLPPRSNITRTNVIQLQFKPIVIRSIDPKLQAIHLEGWTIMQWEDSRLRWNEEEYGIAELRVAIDGLWNPHLTLYNSADTNSNEWVAGPKTKHAVIYPHGQVVWVPAMSINSLCDIDLTNYPFDKHNCTFKFGSWVHSSYHFDIQLLENSEGTGIALSDFWDVNEFSLVATSAVRHEKYYPCCNESYVDVEFGLLIRRQRPVHQAAILFPLSAALILAVFSFLISPFTYHRMQLNAFVLFLFVYSLLYLMNQFPSVGRHIPAIVLISESFIVLISSSIMWNMIILTLFARLKDSQPTSVVQWMLKRWPIKVFFLSHPKDCIQMQECFKGVAISKDPEVEAIVTEDNNLGVNWMNFFILLDRIAFMFFFIISIVILAAFTN